MNDTPSSLLRRARRVAWRPVLRSDLTLIVGVSLLWMLLYNARFWRAAAAAEWGSSFAGAAFLASLFVFALFVQSLLLLWAPRPWLKPLACVLLLLAAGVSYFTGTFGTVMDVGMMRNVVATDRAEAAGLVNFSLLSHLLVLGVLPSLLVLRGRWELVPFKRRLRERTVYFGAGLAVCLVMVLALSATYASFFREHKPLRYLLNPAAPVYSAIRFALKQPSSQPTREVMRIGEPFQRVAYTSSKKPKVLFLVIGETARHANFQLQGYPRATNPQLARVAGLVNFHHVSSCGTATAVSLPCIFSHLDRSKFDVDDAGGTTNLLDMLTAAGVDVEWRDANSGCKGICQRVRTILYAGRQPGDPLCRGPFCFDEVMLRDLDERLAAIHRDTVIVFHEVGSHGPAYWQRYPASFEVFKPDCRSNELNACTATEVANAYDNTIAYTDYNLARQIGLLEAAAEHVDGALLYVSDHGESLGEHGVYLHGMPYAFAPQEQKQVPLLLWMSAGFAKSSAIDPACVRTRDRENLSHDNVFHTVLGAMGVRTPLYDDKLDLLAGCRRTTRQIGAGVRATPSMHRRA